MSRTVKHKPTEPREKPIEGSTAPFELHAALQKPEPKPDRGQYERKHPRG